MAHTLTITDGTTTIDLAVASGNGIYLRYGLQLPPPGEPWDIPFSIVHTSTNSIDSQLYALNQLLRTAATRASMQAGSPVRVMFKRQGTTNTSYARVLSVPVMPHTDGPEDWIDTETIGNELSMRMTLQLEWPWHSGTLLTYNSAQAVTLAPPSASYVGLLQSSDQPNPMTATIAHTSAVVTWAEMWIAQLATVPTTNHPAGTSTPADTNASNGFAGQETRASATFGGSFETANYTPSATRRYRIFARVKVTAGTASKLRLRSVAYTGDALSTVAYGQEVAYTGTSNYLLVDLGDLPRFAHLLERASVNTGQVYAGLQFRTTDATSITIRVDFMQILPYAALVKLANLTAGNTHSVTYEMVRKNGTFYYPDTHKVFETSSTGVVRRIPRRFGHLVPIENITTPFLWVQAQSATTHSIADTAAITTTYLESYAQPLRGAL